MVNSAGLVQPFDGGVPRTITCKAREVISGGWLVFASGADNVVSSGLNSFVTADIQVAAGASGANFTGVALNNAASGAEVTVALRGAYILTAIGAVTPSLTVAAGGDQSVLTTTTATHIIGRAFTGAASGGHCIIHLGVA